MSNHRSYEWRGKASSIRVSIWSICICSLIWNVSLSEAVHSSCCPNGFTWKESSRNCSDGSKIRIECPYGFYKMDPQLDELDIFSVTERVDGTWLTHHYTLTEIRHENFCTVESESGKQIALVCFEEAAVDEGSAWSSVLICVLSIVSAIFLIATLAVYIILPELREIQDKAMMAAVTSLAFSYILLSIRYLKGYDSEGLTMCVTLAFLLYYAFMSSFFWLNIVAFNIWRLVWFKNFIVRDKTLFMIYCVIGCSVPTCFLAIALVAHYVQGSYLKLHFDAHMCWFGGPLEKWAYFYGPIAFLLMMNVIYLSLTSWRLWHEYRDFSGNKLRALRFKCLLYFKLVLVMGITWIFELISFAVGSHDWYWIPTDILNSLQGFIIFLLLVATRKRVRKLLAKKNPCGIIFPKSWVAYEDQECEIVLPEELELSQQA